MKRCLVLSAAILLSSCSTEKFYVPPAQITDNYAKITLVNDEPSVKLFGSYFANPEKCQGLIDLNAAQPIFGNQTTTLYAEKGKPLTLRALIVHDPTGGWTKYDYCNVVGTFTPTQGSYIFRYRVDNDAKKCYVSASADQNGVLSALTNKDLKNRDDFVVPGTVNEPWCKPDTTN